MADHKKGVGPLGYLMGALVILVLGLLYFLITHGLSFWQDFGKKAMPPVTPLVQDVEAVKQPVALSTGDGSSPAKEIVAYQAGKQVVEAEQELVQAQEMLAGEQEQLQVTRAKQAKEQLDGEQLGEERLDVKGGKHELAEEWQVAEEATPEPAMQRPEPKRQAFNLPDGTEIVVPDSGFEGAVKTAMVKHTLNKPMLFDAIQFESGSSKLREGSEGQIKVVAALMNTYKDIKVLIRGHTDSRGAIKANSVLSLTRSGNMKKQLAGLGIAKQRVKIEGVGQLEPLASNDTEEGRNKNRRIELVLVE